MSKVIPPDDSVSNLPFTICTALRTEQPENQRVVCEDGLECWLDEAKGQLTFTGSIDLTRHYRDWQAEVLRQVQLVVRRLPASERFNKTINIIKKGDDRHV